MKKSFYLAFVLMLILGVGCGNLSNNNSNGISGGSKGTTATDANDPEPSVTIVGEWYCGKIIERSDDNDVETVSISLSLNADKTYAMTGDLTGSGTWAYIKDTLTFYKGGAADAKMEFVVQKLTSKEMVLGEPWYENGQIVGYDEYYFTRKASLESGDKPSTPVETENDLKGTKWEGTALQTAVALSFVDDECYIEMSGYANGTAAASYKVSSPDVYITVTRLTGSSDGQLSVGDLISGHYNLNAKEMTIRMSLYEKMQEIKLNQTK